MHQFQEFYHRWFGILPSEMPTHAYRVLGVEPFEPDDDVVFEAAERRRVQLRGYLGGDEAVPATSLLGEIEQIVQCLSNPELRASYDATLRECLKSRQTFVVRLEEPNVPDLEILPDEEPVQFATQTRTSFDSLTMIPMPTQVGEEAAQRLKKKNKNVLVEFAKIIGGGIAGLLLGYLALQYLNPDNDLFRSLGIGPEKNSASDESTRNATKVRVVDENGNLIGEKKIKE